MTSTSNNTTEAVAAMAAEFSLPPDALLAAAADQLVEQAKATGVSLTGEGGLLTGLVRQVLQVLQGALESEITDHLGYAAHAVEGRGPGNSRNRHYPKTVRTEIGDVAVKIPRDCNGSFEPVTVPVGQRRLSGLDQMEISLYAKGLTTGDIAAHLEDVYDQQVDRATIGRITDAIVGDMEAWQSRPLDSIYPVLFVDGIRIKDRPLPESVTSTCSSLI